jgi:hypothetical protein
MMIPQGSFPQQPKSHNSGPASSNVCTNSAIAPPMYFSDFFPTKQLKQARKAFYPRSNNMDRSEERKKIVSVE